MAAALAGEAPADREDWVVMVGRVAPVALAVRVALDSEVRVALGSEAPVALALADMVGSARGLEPLVGSGWAPDSVGLGLVGPALSDAGWAALGRALATARGSHAVLVLDEALDRLRDLDPGWGSDSARGLLALAFLAPDLGPATAFSMGCRGDVVGREPNLDTGRRNGWRNS